jgi:thiosulfate dehydrogenase
MYNKRAVRVISLEDRIQECFTRSENGRPLPSHSSEMQALVAYINWLSRTEVKGVPYKGRGLVKLAALTGRAMQRKASGHMHRNAQGVTVPTARVSRR